MWDLVRNHQCAIMTCIRGYLQFTLMPFCSPVHHEARRLHDAGVRQECILPRYREAEAIN
jgi:hypothetical protein